MGDFETKALGLLRLLTGSPSAEFRSGQEEAIRAVAESRKRVLVVQRTGWGKSAVYLVATRLLRDAGEGPTVIVSPLLALMRNQLEMTRNLGLNATTINSTNPDDWDETIDQVRRGEVDLLLISPERLNNVQFRKEVGPFLFSSLGLLVIDEVHCISDWGHDFRPDYRRLKRIVESLPPGVPILGTTATANDRVVRDVSEQLGDQLDLFRGTLERKSLALEVLTMPHQAARMAWLADHVPKMSGSGIIYCLTVRDAQRLAEFLRSVGIVASEYTGQMDSEDRLDVEAQLTDGSVKVVVATSALAMGYDNPAIEFVIHYQIPGSPIAYYQQVGRAGRAVDSAHGIAMSGAEDRDIQDWFISTAFPEEEDVNVALTAMSADGGMTKRSLQEAVNIRWSRLEAMLKILEVEGAVYRDGSKWFRSAQRWSYPTERVAAVTASRRMEQAAMAEFVTTEQCLMEFLREQLDDPGAERCGRCSNCTGVRSSTEVDGVLVRRALASFRSDTIEILPRKQLPCDLGAAIDLRRNALLGGRCLTRWGDPGLAEKVELGKYRHDRFDDELVKEMAELIEGWHPEPSPSWITWLPSSSGSELVADFATRLGNSLGLPVIESLVRVQKRPPQKTMENSCQQARNVVGAFEVVTVESGPVFLIDDMVDSRWTFTVVGSQLRSMGSGEVYPVALADTSQSAG